MSEDLIKRSDAIDVISSWFEKIELNPDILIDGIKTLPSADRPSAVDLSSVYSTAYKSGYEKGKADRPQGEWIDDEFLGQYRCSECDYYSVDEFDYCPNCGARMKGADDE